VRLCQSLRRSSWKLVFTCIFALSRYDRILLMSRSLPASKKSDSYHHGNLRQALLEAARELAAEAGVDGLTLREVARRAGVSHAAPYHHFSDKATLVQALAGEAFEKLTEAMLEAKHQHAEPLAALRATGLGYVKFALSFPTEFRFMFRRDLGISSRPDASRPASQPDINQPASQSEHLQRASSAAFQVLLDAILECQQAGLLAENDPQVMAMSAWSTTHGLASIILDGPVGTQLRDLEQAEPLAEAVLRTLMRGLERR
jgi:AcrR family transcriptional regulator